MKNNKYNMTLIFGLGLIFSALAFSKTTGPIPEDEEYMVEQSKLDTPEWIQEYESEQPERKAEFNLNSDEEINQPECKIGRENSQDLNNVQFDFELGIELYTKSNGD